VNEVAGETVEQGAGVAAVDRALSVVAAIAAQAEPRTLAELAAATGLYKSTILRLLGSLEKASYAVRLRDGRYALGAAACRLGLAYERANPLRQHVLPVLRDLVEGGSESASFHVRQTADTRLCLFRVDSHHSTLDRVAAGDILPLDQGAAGRMLLAFDGAPGASFMELRAQGFAISIGEGDPNCGAMAAPVFGPDGALRGAVSLSGPRERFTEALIAAYRPRLIQAAAEITRSLGGRR
jgi:DNA-binding IclR family transcriptional regulator